MTICIGWLWVFARTYAGTAMSGWELKRGIARAEKVRDSILADPQSSDTDKANATQAVADLKALQLVAVREHYERVKADLTNG